MTLDSHTGTRRVVDARAVRNGVCRQGSILTASRAAEERWTEMLLALKCRPWKQGLHAYSAISNR